MIPAEAVFTHQMATIRVDVPSGTCPHYEAGRLYLQNKHDAIDKQIAEWLEEGILESCSQASPWKMGRVVVPKATEPGMPLKYRV